ncbi:hypothetical protein POSPLADRAFT_1065996 [Postia placenta MAD-698-R-SB12]|uniref:Uncharacterized protein n=1 Tax=Postia placenta MAD-698-R-SB12 TaxID=670580 RepID=A0A1X6N342_9APHY|nr:hypothetical protein POSPLADRAFT_1065996 [Postia placenta MAD-698-R-SB12]OSX63049.1 hypothetical protein POSPLADRAFT_1065996 [Postia placenta MAD-698-R-SB12]
MLTMTAVVICHSETGSSGSPWRMLMQSFACHSVMVAHRRVLTATRTTYPFLPRQNVHLRRSRPRAWMRVLQGPRLPYRRTHCDTQYGALSGTHDARKDEK